MSEPDQGQTGGFAKSEKVMIVRGAIVALLASLITLRLSGAFAGDGPPLVSIEVLAACLLGKPV